MVNKKIGGRRRIIVGMLATCIGLGTFLQFVPVAHAAEATVTWKDASTITLAGSALAMPVDMPGAEVPSTGIGSPLGSKTWAGSAPSVNMSFGCTATAVSLYVHPTSTSALNYSRGELIFDMGPGGCTRDQLNANIPGLTAPISLIQTTYPQLSKYVDIANVAARGGGNNGGGQAVSVTVVAGMMTASDYTNLPANDRLILCQSTGSYTTNPVQLDTDCLAMKSGVVTMGPLITGGVTTIQDNRGPNGGAEKGWQAVFKNVKAPANYTVCSINFNACQAFPTASGQDMTVYIEWGGQPNVKIPGTPASGSQTVNEPQLGCDVTFDLTTIFSLKWLVCPIVNAATYMVGKLDDTINSMLTIDVKDVFQGGANSVAYHQAWNSFRFFALGLIVIAALIMVVSQAAGVEILDAYTIRKILPRLLFAAIFIALSWSILEFLVEFSNEVGQGVRTLIYAPFQGLAKNNTLGGGSSVSLVLIGTGGILAFGWIGLLSFALTGMLACLVAFAVLVLRKMLIILLIMMAPFAIAAYVLPSTQKLWTVWKDGLLSALLVYPIITGMIAIGRVFSTTAFNTTSFNAPGGQIVSQIIAVIAYFAPYFMISMAFRLAGGFIATIGGVVNDRGRGAFDRLKNFRGNRVSQRATKMAHGQLYQETGPFKPLARGFNALTGGAATYAKSQSKVGFLFDKRVRDAAFAQQRDLNQMTYAQSEQAKALADNDPALQAQTYRNAAEARRNMIRDFKLKDIEGGPTAQEQVEAGIAAAKANGGFGRDQQLYAARRLFDTGTGYADYQTAHETVSRVAGTNRELAASTFGFGNAKSGEKGRLDLKSGYGTYMKLWDKRAEGKVVTPGDYDGAVMDAIQGNDALSMLRGKPMAAKNTMPVLRRAITSARRDADAGDEDAKVRLGKLTGILEQYEQSTVYASPTNTQAVDELAMQPTVRAGTIDRVHDATGERTSTGDPNGDRDRSIESGYLQQRPSGTFNPRDPHRQL